ncbi:MAG: DUF4276 family protein [Pseudomonadota bacterium]
MRRIVFLLEDRSMKHFLEAFIPRFFPGLIFLCIPHDGKTDLEASIPRKLKGWNVPGDRFIVIRDNDGSNCKKLKAKLVDLCVGGGRPDTLVRIACQELEAWYLGDLDSLKNIYGLTVNVNQNKQPYRNPDGIGSPTAEVERLADGFQKTDGARCLGAVLNPRKNQSISFKMLVAGIEKVSGQTAVIV